MEDADEISPSFVLGRDMYQNPVLRLFSFFDLLSLLFLFLFVFLKDVNRNAFKMDRKRKKGNELRLFRHIHASSIFVHATVVVDVYY